ncbi:MAG: CsbD family protein [Desulfuromonadales bacterium]|nr:CsbD family protein [Desulfuromonadales bacterium]
MWQQSAVRQIGIARTRLQNSKQEDCTAEATMKHQVEGRWEQVKGIARELWGELSGDEQQFNAGQIERLVGRMQEKYDLSRDEAKRRVDDFLSEGNRSS